MTWFKRVPPSSISCDVLVIGGGSGGIACAQAVSKKVPQVVLCDFVRPSPIWNSTWGLGGTCVNVGCVPKKLFHRAGLLGLGLRDGEFEAFGFSKNAINPVDQWKQIVSTVQNHIKMLNFTYSATLPENCTYINGQASFETDSQVQIKNNDSITKVNVQKAIVIAVGGRPMIPEKVPGATSLGMTSDDIFSTKTHPNKTLVIGGSYIGLETASFLAGIGCDTSLLIRSQPLRGTGFDADSAKKLVELIAGSGVKIIFGKDLQSLQEVNSERKIQATFHDGSNEIYNTVLFGTGRRPETHILNLPSHVKVNDKNEKVIVDKTNFVASKGTSTTPTIYAIGDCAETDSPELTPVAIRQGELVASIVGNEKIDEKRTKALQFVPSTVFTLPSEYSRIGLSEAEAIKRHGEENVSIYHREWQPLESSASHVKSVTGDDAPYRGYSKLICLKNENEKVIGLHLISPNAGEAIHGLALSLSLGATKRDFDARVLGIHPTDAEALTDMNISKASGLPYQVSSGCGGGKCG